MIKSAILLVGIALLVSACRQTESAKPDLSSYNEDTKLMMNICSKFSEELDAKELHKSAVATQYARLINRRDFNNETNLYLEFVNKVIKSSSDHSISNEERLEFRSQCEKLRIAIEEGRAKLSN